MNLPRTSGAQPRRLLVVALADLGDVLLTTPALQALRAAQPQAHIAILTTPVGAAVLRDLPVYDELIVFEKWRFNRRTDAIRPHNLWYAFGLWQRLRAGYDTTVLLHHLTTWFGTLKYAVLAWTTGARRRIGLDNGRGFFLTDRVRDQGFGVQHQAEYWQSVVGLLGAQPHPTRSTFTIPDDAHAEAAQLLGDRSDRLIALHPGSGAYAPARRWPTHHFAAVADALIADGWRVVLIGGPEEAPLRLAIRNQMQHGNDLIDLGGRTPLPVLAAVLGRCLLLVGNDSGLAHLAGSVGTPVVAIFGPTDPRAWGPYAGTSWQIEAQAADGVAVFRAGPHRALKATIACSPCIYRGHGLGTPNGCPDRTCLSRIDVEQTLAVIRQRINELSDQPCASTIS